MKGRQACLCLTNHTQKQKQKEEKRNRILGFYQQKQKTVEHTVSLWGSNIKKQKCKTGCTVIVIIRAKNNILLHKLT